jgi:hypothetical protein
VTGPCFSSILCGGTWTNAPPLFMLFQKGFPALLWSFEFNVIFV